MYVCFRKCQKDYRIRIVCNLITIKEQKRTKSKKFENFKNSQNIYEQVRNSLYAL